MAGDMKKPIMRYEFQQSNPGSRRLDETKAVGSRNTNSKLSLNIVDNPRQAES
jgi:hypothetical protein